MKSLDDIAIGRGADKSTLYHGYAPVYERHFAKWRNEPIQLLEIGVQFGASIKTWLEYFSKAVIIGVDIAHEFHFEHERYIFRQGNQGDPAFVKGLDFSPTIVIDDGGHRMAEINASFLWLWNRLKPGGLYCIEDWFAVAHEDFFKTHMDAQAWLSEMVACVHWHGKSYHGKPQPDPTPELNQFEREIAFIEITKGLIIIGKK